MVRYTIDRILGNKRGYKPRQQGVSVEGSKPEIEPKGRRE